MAVCAAYKQPLRGFSGLMVTAMAASCGARRVTTVGACAFLRRVQHRPRHTLRNPSSLIARVLNAFHDLHASMTTSSLPPAAVAAFLAGAGTSATALRFVVFFAIAFFGAIARSWGSAKTLCKGYKRAKLETAKCEYMYMSCHVHVLSTRMRAAFTPLRISMSATDQVCGRGVAAAERLTARLCAERFAPTRLGAGQCLTTRLGA